MTTYTTTGTAITENGSGVAMSLSTVSFAVVVADSATPSQNYTIATTSNGWVPAVDVSFPNSADLSVGGMSTNQSNFLDGPTDFAFFGDITWNDGGASKVTTVFGYWDDDTNTRYIFTMDGDALPSFADASAYNSWLTNDVTLFSQSGMPYGPGDSIDLSAVGGFSSTEDDTINGTDLNDVLSGGNGNDTLLGNGGFDVLQGGNGADILNGGADFDIANYRFEGGASGVTASLLTNLATDSFGNTDTLVSIEGFFGTQSADTFHGDGGSNLFEGNAGADRFYGYGGYDVVDYSYEIGGAGIEMQSNFFNSNFSVLDTFGNLDTGSSIEAIYATEHDDILRAQGHDTYYNGLGGDDQIYAYTGDDTLFGGDGFDILSGGAGNDIIDGGGTGAEDELHYGGFLVDSVTVDMVNGVAISSSGDVDQFFNIFRIVGSYNADHFIGNGENNEFVGGNGYDTIDGGGGVDKVRYDLEASITNSGINADLTTGDVWASYAGIDTLINIEWIVGSVRDDTMLGNADSNILEGHLGDDVMDGGAGIDTLSFYFAGFNTTVDLAVTTQQYTIVAGFDTISNFENILGSSFNDTYFGDGGDNVIQGGAGADAIDGRGNGPNGDTASYENSTARVIVNLSAGTGAEGDAAGDTLVNIENLIGSDHNDQLTGSSIGNSIRGGAGNDEVFDRGGDDVVELGSGNDYVRVGGGVDSFDGGSGTDYISYYDSTNGITADLAANTISGSWAVNDTINSFEGISGSRTGDDVIYGTSGANIIRTYGGDDRVYARGGTDIVELGDGNDYVRVGGGVESFDGGDGVDYISYYDSSNGITANLAANTISGSWAVNDSINSFEGISGSRTGDDEITGTSGANIIKTYGGNDRVYAGGGSDDVELGSGNDYVRVGGGAESFDGGSGTDYISYYDSSNGITIDFAADTVSGSWAVNDTVINFEGGSGSNTGNDKMYGSSGKNTLKGFGGDDSLYGRSGDDKLYGGSGEDRFDGGAGTDRLWGGSGEDTFHLDFGEGHDIIEDFEDNVDVIQLDNFTFGTGQDAFDFATQVGDDVVFDFGGGDGLTVLDATIGQLANDLVLV